MGIFLIVFAALLLIVLAMSVGVIMGGKPIAGSCGGMASLGMDTACDVCGGDKTICEDEDEKNRRITQLAKTDDLAYEVKTKS
ncbi:(Na+)-NQR maturation NqrM [Neptunomonas antarctica]|uniref:ApbE family protein n=1 Tax=Neptunomonas antarctica TaxID=619304 RepID=A0A1N7LR38_9GAMM|nr:(Na+)-NQR maturation NqrM [Neptunomonas antarctica]SIS76310.1 hypothetical protein SAMN05421760_104263 [Neptunomonas antarctica]